MTNATNSEVVRILPKVNLSTRGILAAFETSYRLPNIHLQFAIKYEFSRSRGIYLPTLVIPVHRFLSRMATDNWHVLA
ncbi:hypothetical protein DPMN_052513 [Dreissena polymorpha]|uniref:Uncharacterized protein n=1 Tax=Dreissena polymorpha TaxID=45954 RepID=A0A9D4CL47_DREPO|nr:hypothetical protein DPMN_052513 [Dreissena polymorpha]